MQVYAMHMSPKDFQYALPTPPAAACAPRVPGRAVPGF